MNGCSFKNYFAFACGVKNLNISSKLPTWNIYDNSHRRHSSSSKSSTISWSVLDSTFLALTEHRNNYANDRVNPIFHLTERHRAAKFLVRRVRKSFLGRSVKSPESSRLDKDRSAYGIAESAMKCLAPSLCQMFLSLFHNSHREYVGFTFRAGAY